jgi:hypothetical protein
MRLTTILIVTLSIIVFVLAILYVVLGNKSQEIQTPQGKITPIPTAFKDDYVIISVSPPNGSKNVSLNSPIIVTFEKKLDPSVKIVLGPDTEFTENRSEKSITLIPKTAWEAGMPYTITIKFPKSEVVPYSFNFTTAGPLPTQLPDTAPITEIEKYNELIKNERPDLFVGQFLPYENSTFLATYDFTKEPTDHYYVTVISKSDEQLVRKEFNTWLESLGLTPSQISKLDIRYQ